eukprot:TRINITY_DN113323_c0_g1_i1.p1 TRINITY_DN113323_c0_g1~~TRINITY_DN113323_c0_g1_i1.p1  ORF type:complete len:341 (-),score=63.19 TRINITY_DN113323_c0_g1_i1:578-1600(-)
MAAFTVAPVSTFSVAPTSAAPGRFGPQRRSVPSSADGAAAARRGDAVDLCLPGKSKQHLHGAAVCLASVAPMLAGSLSRRSRRRLICKRGKRIAAFAVPSEKDTGKIDTNPDELFYMVPRIGMYHVDDGFRRQLSDLYRLLIPARGNVLDLCSQHDSHLPTDIDYDLTIHGMNYLELMANTRASERFTRNFNSEPSLSNLADASFDAVTMTVSIQYMQKPVELLSEIKRVLRPGGVLIISFSNRMFFTKAVEVWREQASMRGLAKLVKGYFQSAGFEGIKVANGVKRLDGGKDDGGLFSFLPSMGSDPFGAVVGYKESVKSVEGLDAVSWLPLDGEKSIW